VAEVADRLASAGVPAGVVVDARDIARNPQLLHRNFFETEHHPISGEARLPSGAWKFATNHQPWVRRAAPTLGQHNDEVFRELLALSDAELDRLRADGIIGEMPKGA
jgi:crotonobetainyl-CoA:carnitine CoA-transferase CaiB-like acyl-CoA transferase